MRADQGRVRGTKRPIARASMSTPITNKVRAGCWFLVIFNPEVQRSCLRCLALCGRLPRFSCSGIVDDLAAQQRELAVQFLDRVGRDGVEVAIPDGDVGVLTGFERADPVFEKELVRGPDGVGLECGVNIYCFDRAKG